MEMAIMVAMAMAFICIRPLSFPLFPWLPLGHLLVATLISYTIGRVVVLGANEGTHDKLRKTGDVQKIEKTACGE